MRGSSFIALLLVAATAGAVEAPDRPDSGAWFVARSVAPISGGVTLYLPLDGTANQTSEDLVRVCFTRTTVVDRMLCGVTGAAPGPGEGIAFTLMRGTAGGSYSPTALGPSVEDAEVQDTDAAVVTFAVGDCAVIAAVATVGVPETGVFCSVRQR
jgi:hypothetical protein